MERGEEERERGRKGAREGRERTYLLDIQTREKEKMKACGEAVGGVKPRSSAQLPKSGHWPIPDNANPGLPQGTLLPFLTAHKRAPREPSLYFPSGAIKFKLRPAPSLGSCFTDSVYELKSLAEDRACPQLPGTGPIRISAGGLECLPPALHPGPQPAQIRWAPGLEPQSLAPCPRKRHPPRRESFVSLGTFPQLFCALPRRRLMHPSRILQPPPPAPNTDVYQG